MKQFEEIKVLGDGAFGVVTKCRNKENNSLVAIKRMKRRYETFEQCLQEKEVKSLRKIKHENVEKLLQVFRENEYLYLVFELLGESLLKTINRQTAPFTNEEVRYIMEQLFMGLNVIHRQGFFHRDIKPDNILWGDNNVLKIADFGLAREIRSRPPYTEYISTRWYRAPEIILRHPFYNSPVDIWAAGAIMAELFLLRPVFQGTSETDQIYKICAVIGAPNSDNWPDGVKLARKRNIILPSNYPQSLSLMMPNACPEAIDLMNSIFQYDPSKRPSAYQALQHPFFKGTKIPPRIGSQNTEETRSENLSTFIPNRVVKLENTPQQFAEEQKQTGIKFTSPSITNKIISDALYSPPTAPPFVIKKNTVQSKNYSKSALTNNAIPPSADNYDVPKRTPSYLKGSLFQGVGARTIIQGANTSFGPPPFNDSDFDLF